MPEGEEGRRVPLQDSRAQDQGEGGSQEIRGHQEEPKQKQVPRKFVVAGPVSASTFSTSSPCW